MYRQTDPFTSAAGLVILLLAVALVVWELYVPLKYVLGI